MDAASMSATPAAIMRATNSSESMVREVLLMVSMKDAAEYCMAKEAHHVMHSDHYCWNVQECRCLAVKQSVLPCILVCLVRTNIATKFSMCDESVTDQLCEEVCGF